jgi:hypothetical protein
MSVAEIKVTVQLGIPGTYELRIIRDIIKERGKKA